MDTHAERLAKEIGDEDACHSVTNAAVVLDRPLMGAYVNQFELPIWTMWELPKKLNT
ncbi:MAG TPA: hypothetical protein VK680_04640 [Solirubrobacteraceae bacterium]|nr:hypothetical protein [Solirubrobacteraceae bacterium]